MKKRGQNIPEIIPGPLFERYRPRTWDQVIGQNQAVEAVNRIRAGGGLAGRAYWVSGISGR